MLVSSVRVASPLQGSHPEEDDYKGLTLLPLLHHVVVAEAVSNGMRCSLLQKAMSKQSDAQQQMCCSKLTDTLSQQQ